MVSYSTLNIFMVVYLKYVSNKSRLLWEWLLVIPVSPICMHYLPEFLCMFPVCVCKNKYLINLGCEISPVLGFHVAAACLCVCWGSFFQVSALCHVAAEISVPLA